MIRWLLGAAVVSLLLREDAPGAAPADQGTAQAREDGRDGARLPAPVFAEPPSPAPVAAAAPDPAVTPAPATLVAHLRALLERPEVTGIDRLSVVVVDEGGALVAALQPDRPVTPASTTKLVTAAAAWRLLGPDYRYVTRLYATGEPESGTLDGDLVMVGSGDSALASPVFTDSVHPQRPHTPLARLADAVAAAGIRKVTGAVRGDPRLFADEPVPEGWVDRYFDSLDATPVSGLTVDGGRHIFERDEDLLAEPAEDPATETARVLTELLDERGVTVAGEPATGRLPPDAREVARVRSPPLSELLTYVVQHSDNHLADGIFRTLGAAAGGGTWEDSAAAAIAALDGLVADWDGAVLADGSGLSREGRLTARHLAELDRAMTTSAPDRWRSLMAVAGESGTLRTRLRGTAAEGRLYGKTGALQDARALAGHVDAPDGRRYHFAILGSELDGPGIGVVRTLMDEIVVLLAGPVPSCLPAEEPGVCP